MKQAVRKNWFVFLAGFALVLAVLMVAGAGAAPKPSQIPLPGTWQLECELHGDPQQINVILPGDSQPTRFWFLLFTVTNNTGQDVDFYPQIDVFTDTMKLYHSDAKSRQVVFEAIRKRYERTIPLLETESHVTSKILQGKDNARDGVAVFEDFDPNARGVQIFVAGLSNETVRVGNPTLGEDVAEVLLRKTLVLYYQVPGDKFNPEDRVMLHRGRDWIMR